MNHVPIPTLNDPILGSRSHRGARSKANDDYCDYFDVDRVDLETKITVAVVADGITTTPGGDQASRIAVETIKATLTEPPSKQETLSEWLEYAIKRANEEITFEAKKNSDLERMSTTVVMAVLAGEKLYVLHLGDSRAYLIRQNAIYQLTADHTWTQEAMAAGSITAEEAIRHPGRNQLQRYLGTRKELDVDRGIIAPGTIRREEFLIAQAGDAVLLCTDGVHGRVSDEEICQTVLEHAGYPQDAVDELIERALDKGERDDITAVLLELPPDKKRDLVPAPAAETPLLADSPAAEARPRPTRIRLWVLLLLVSILALLLLTIFLLSYGAIAQTSLESTVISSLSKRTLVLHL